jgi:hypothetical protein
VQSPCNPLIEDYTEIFYIIDEGDIPSILRNISLRGPQSMRKVDGPSLIFIDFYVPALTPRLSSNETSLHDSLCSLGADRIGNTASNSSSITACVRCLAMALVLLCAYRAVA